MVRGDSLERWGDRENSSAGEKEGRAALDSLGVEVRDLQELEEAGEGRVLRREETLGERGGRGGRARGRDSSDLDTLEGTDRNNELLREPGRSSELS